MEIKILTVIESQLDDVQETLNHYKLSISHNKLDYVKWLMNKYRDYSGNFKIDPDACWEAFRHAEKLEDLTNSGKTRPTKQKQKQYYITTEREKQVQVKYRILKDEEILRKGDQYILKRDIVNEPHYWLNESQSYGAKAGHYPEHIFRRANPEPIDMPFKIRGETPRVYPGERISIGCDKIEGNQVRELAVAFFGDASLLKK